MNDVGVTTQKKYDRLVGSLVTIFAFLLYLSTLAPTVLEADAGEFQFVAWLPGIAHPTGYPFYILLGWVWSHVLPIGEVAWRMNLLSALCAAGAVGLTYAVSGQLLEIALPATPYPARLIAAITTAFTFAVTPTFWSQAIIAEVYALHALLVASIFWITIKVGTIPQPNNHRWGIALAFTFGLSLTHHITTILMLPAVLLYLWRRTTSYATNLAAWVSLISRYALVAVLPLLLYLSLPLFARFAPYTTLMLSDNQILTLYDNSFQGWIQHITGSTFAGAIQPAAVGTNRFEMSGLLLYQQIGWAGIALSLAGLITLWQERCFDLMALTGLAFMTIISFNLVYFIGDVFVLFIPAWFIVCLWLGLGILGASHWAASRFVRNKTAATDAFSFGQVKEKLSKNLYWMLIIGFVGFFFALPLLRLAVTLPTVNQRSNTISRDRWQQILSEPIPNTAILMSNDRNEIMPMWYYQYVEHKRPDLIGLFPQIVPDPGYATIGSLLDQALASERPVYFIKNVDDLAIKADLAAEGTLIRATSPGLSPTHSIGQTFSNNSEAITLIGLDAVTSMASQRELMVTLYWQIDMPLSTDYTSYVHLLDQDGIALSQSDHQPGGTMYPSSQWRPDEILRDQHQLVLPTDTPMQKAYRLRVGLYYQPHPDNIVSLGHSLETGQVAFE